MRTVTCHTKGCGNENIDIEIFDIGTVVHCGVCGQQIADADPEKFAEYQRRVDAGEIS